MEGNVIPQDFKNKSFLQHNESDLSVVGSSDQWQDKGRDCKQLKRPSQDDDWSRESTSNGKAKKMQENTHSANPLHSQQPTLNQPSTLNQPISAAPYSTYGYGNSDHTAYPMMPPYMYPMNHAPWPVSSMEGMTMPAVSSTGMEMTAPSSGMNAYPYMGMSGDGSMMMPVMQNVGGYVPHPMMGGPENVMPPIIPQEVKLTKSVLYPPKSGIKPPTREKPPGCKTVYVGGLPEKITEEIIREAFETCGEIVTIRMSKKNFCHIFLFSQSSTHSIKNLHLHFGFF